MTKPADDISARYPQLVTRQRMAPLMQRIIAFLETAKEPIGADALAEIVFGAENQVRKHLRRLHQERIVRIAGWAEKPPGVCGDYHRLFAMANGEKDTPKPKRPSSRQRLRKWRGRLHIMLGDKYKFVAQSAKCGGSQTLVMGGKVVYQRYKGVRYDALKQVSEWDGSSHKKRSKVA